MAKKKPSFSTVVSFMSEETQNRLREEQTETNLTLPLEAIRPDPEQPRQLLDEGLISAVLRGELLPATAIQQWLGQENNPLTPHGIKENIEQLLSLAGSIAQHGLINPITVRPVPPSAGYPATVKYLVVTGERRYWAHVLLTAQGRVIQEGSEQTQPTHIKATLAPAGVSIRAHQLIENIHREDLNAIERAQGLWALRYELSGRENDPQAKLVPWEMIENSLGMSKRHRIRVISVLDLAPSVQQLVLQNGLSERAIRPIVEKLKGQEEQQVSALNHLLLLQSGTVTGLPTLESFIEKLLPQVIPAPSATEATTSQPAGRVTSWPAKVQRVLREFEKIAEKEVVELTQDDKTAVLHDLQQLQTKIKQLIGSIQKR